MGVVVAASDAVSYDYSLLQMMRKESLHLAPEAAVFDEHRGHRMRRTSVACDQRLNASAEAAGSFGACSPRRLPKQTRSNLPMQG